MARTGTEWEARMSRRNRKYGFRPGSRVSGIKPEVAARELERINHEQGAVTPEAVVEEAAPADAPLHPAFEWDNGKAAQEYRLAQARTLIRAVVVEYEAKPSHAAYVHVVVDGEGQYKPAEVVVNDVDLYQSAVLQLREWLASARRSVSELETLAQEHGQKSKAKRVAAVDKHLVAAEQAAEGLA